MGDVRGRHVRRMKIKEALEVLGEPYAASYHSIHFFAWVLDVVIKCPCCCCSFGIGIDPLLGLIPVIGDFIGLILALVLVLMCIPLGISAYDFVWMMIHVIVDFLVGEIIIVGDIIDFFYQCNEFNLQILEQSLIRRAEAKLHEMEDAL